MKGVHSLGMHAALWAISVLAIGMIIIDLLALVGVAVLVFCILPLLLRIFCPRKRHPVYYSVVTSALIRIDVFFKPPGIPIPYRMFKRTLGTLILWGVALGLIHYNRAREGRIGAETI